jgi:hypothetical protein
MKLDIHDLRIGNLFLNQQTGFPIKITANDILFIEQSGDIFCFKPIPFNKELLKKIPDFHYDDMLDTNDENAWYHLKYGNYKFSSDESSNFESVFIWINKTAIEIKYLHDLQNIFRDLTKTNLEITL